jgi:hypothetical protein
MRIKITGLLIGVLGFACMAVQAQEPQGLIVARKQYMRQVKPIQDRYIRSLKMMKQKFIRENDHQAVGSINQEIELIKDRQKAPSAIAAKKSSEDQSKYSVSGKCMFYRTPDNKWMKILYFREDGKILGSNHKNEVRDISSGRVISRQIRHGGLFLPTVFSQRARLPMCKGVSMEPWAVFVHMPEVIPGLIINNS